MWMDISNLLGFSIVIHLWATDPWYSLDTISISTPDFYITIPKTFLDTKQTLSIVWTSEVQALWYHGRSSKAGIPWTLDYQLWSVSCSISLRDYPYTSDDIHDSPLQKAVRLSPWKSVCHIWSNFIIPTVIRPDWHVTGEEDAPSGDDRAFSLSSKVGQFD